MELLTQELQGPLGDYALAVVLAVCGVGLLTLVWEVLNGIADNVRCYYSRRKRRMDIVPSLREILAANAQGIRRREAEAAAGAEPAPAAPLDALDGVPRVERKPASTTIPALGGIMDQGGRHGPRGGNGPNSGNPLPF